jgi:hypothetical protein
MPPAGKAPTRAKPRKEPKYPTRFDTHRFRITLRAFRPVWQDPEKYDRRCDTAQNEQAAENDDEQRGVGHYSRAMIRTDLAVPG